MAFEAISPPSRKIRYYGSLAAVYVLTLLFVSYVAQPLLPFGQARAAALTKSAQKPHLSSSRVQITSGLPARIVIPASGVDLPVDQGYYDSTTDSWTLSGYHAQFAMLSTLANNYGGETFIYGHNNNYVFGALRHVTPTPGATALIYTSNGHVFAYTFRSAQSLGPTDTAILDYSGPPIMVIQTCTGSLNEWRTMYTFDFSKVVQ
ncbi:MAG TPA: sortase [Candidatus Saccharimonadales bacterium]